MSEQRERIPLQECVEHLHKRHVDEVEDGESPEFTEVLGDTLLHIGELKQKNAHLQADVDAALKQVGELEFSIEAQLRTIQEQSDTLMNREKLVDDLKEQLEQLRTANESIVAPNDEQPEIVRSVMAGIEIIELADALEGYGLNVVRMSKADNHALVGSAFIKVGYALRAHKTWNEAMNWLKGVE